MKILDKVSSSKDLKKLNIKELEQLCDEIREQVLEVTKSNGGHLSSNLGIIETTVAVHYVFDLPTDKLIFDVGHQCYAHKILSDRKDRFITIRTEGGISGFTDKEESVYDTFTSGHAGNSVALGLGLTEARDAVKDDYYVVDILGDGAFVNGLNLEALTAGLDKPLKYIVILNDNGMSISKNKNGIYNYLCRHTISRGYVGSKKAFKYVFRNSFVTRFFSRIKSFVKRLFGRGMWFENFGFKYVGIIDGNNVGKVVKALQQVKEFSKNRAVFLHINTTKGKGFSKAEENSELYHGVGKNLSTDTLGFSEALGNKLNSLIEKDNKIVAITAAMMDGTGLKTVSETHPENFVDVGIAEEFAVTYAAGLATGGAKPVVCIYSTFLQRAFDQIMHDVCMQNLPVVFCLDRAGLVGADGKSHQGIYDLSYLSMMPNMKVLCPTNTNELEYALEYALSVNSPVAIRYPKSEGKTKIQSKPFKESLWQNLTEGKDITVLAVGPKMIDLAYEFSNATQKQIRIISARTVKPLDYVMLNTIDTPLVFTLEENTVIGGFGSSITKYFSDNNGRVKVVNFGVKDRFIKHGTIDSQLKENGLTVENLLQNIKE